MPGVHINGNSQFPMYINKQTRLTQIQLNSDSNRAYTALILLISMLTTRTDSTQSVRSTTSFYMLCHIILNGCLQSQHSFCFLFIFRQFWAPLTVARQGDQRHSGKSQNNVSIQSSSISGQRSYTPPHRVDWAQTHSTWSNSLPSSALISGSHTPHVKW